MAKAAPFLTLDADPYPVVAARAIYWVVDGYTTTDHYPVFRALGLPQATSTSQTPAGRSPGRRPAR